jgi:hypothetical protein
LCVPFDGRFGAEAADWSHYDETLDVHGYGLMPVASLEYKAGPTLAT